MGNAQRRAEVFQEPANPHGRLELQFEPSKLYQSEFALLQFKAGHGQMLVAA